METNKRLEEIFGEICQYRTPSETDDHPELNNSDILSNKMHQKYQMLIGILIWMCVLGWSDVVHATTSLSRFSACLRQGHFDKVLRVFGYLKKRPNRRFFTGSAEPIFLRGEESTETNFVEEFADKYPNFSEKIDINLQPPLFDEILIIILIGADHAHDKLS